MTSVIVQLAFVAAGVALFAVGRTRRRTASETPVSAPIAPAEAPRDDVVVFRPDLMMRWDDESVYATHRRVPASARATAPRRVA